MRITSTSHCSPRRHPATGSVIVLVLVTILVAAFMLTKFVDRAGTELLADARAGDRLRLRREAYSALEVALAVLADFRAVDHGLYSPAQGWDRPLDYAGYVPANGLTVDLQVEDESGRVSLPRADAAAVEALFVSLGADSRRAEQAGEALMSWMYQDYVPAAVETDAGDYDRAVLPYQAAGRPLRSWDELTAVAVVRDLLFDGPGRPNEWYRQLTDTVSLQSFDRMNLNAARPTALVIAGLTAKQIDALQDRVHPFGRDAAFLRGREEVVALLGDAVLADRFGTEAQVLRITITVRDGAASYGLAAVVAPVDRAGTGPVAPERAGVSSRSQQTEPASAKKLDYPFKVLEMTEELEPSDDTTAHD